MQVASVSLWSRNGFTGSRNWEGTVSPECRQCGVSEGGTGEPRRRTVKLRAYPADDPLDAGRWINSTLRTPPLLLFHRRPLVRLGIISALTNLPDLPLEMTEEYVLRCVLMLCCALLSANA
ncbi:hypothetical protein FQN60_009365, partial [Etheostoma spectabile]